MQNIKNLSKSKPFQRFLRHSLTVVSCALITGAGIAFVVWATAFSTTIIGEDIVTRHITVSGDATGDLKAETGRAATIVVAASDSSPQSKAQADFVADGVDDQVTIQKAIDALSPPNVLYPVGGKVLLMEGTFNISSTIFLRTKVKLEGVGWGTVVRLKDGHNGHISMLIGMSSSRIANFTIDANNAMQDLAFHNSPIWMGDVTGVTIEGMRLMDGYTGINISGGSDVLIANNHISGMRGDGIGPNASSRLVITGNIVRNSTAGIDLFYCLHSVVSGNTIDNAGFSGIELHGVSSWNIISGNIITNSARGISIMSNSNYNQLLGNSIHSSGVHSIYVEANHITVKGNIIEKSGHTGIIFAGANSGIITGNRVVNSQRRGVDIAASNDVIVNSNFIKASGLHAHHAISQLWVRMGSKRVRIIENVLRQGTQPNRPRYGIAIEACTIDAYVIHNDLRDAALIPYQNMSLSTIDSQQFVEHHMDVLAASAIHVRADINPDGLTHTDVTSPDIPRNIMSRITNIDRANPQTPSGGNIVVHGIDARGFTVSETLVVPATSIPAGGTLDIFGSIAFAKVTLVTYYSETNTNITVSLGISNKIGLGNPIHTAGDVFKIRRNALDINVGVVDLVNRTVDLSPITTGDDITIFYKANLNILR